jgi:DNA polymerase-4
VTVKIKWADFQQSTRRRSLKTPFSDQHQFRQVALDLIRLVFPPPKGIRLIGVGLSNFTATTETPSAKELAPDSATLPGF